LLGGSDDWHGPGSVVTIGLSPVMGAGISLCPCWKITSLKGLVYRNLRPSPRPGWHPWTPVPYQPRFGHRIVSLGASAGSSIIGVGG
jgi:hypothetical protein